MDSEKSDIDVFKEALGDDDPQVQMAAINSLPAMALALDCEKTRSLLLPYLLENVTEINEEMQINTAEQLKRFIPLVGGYDHLDLLLQILVKLCLADETLVREKAVESINTITEDLNGKDCELHLLPVIQDLSAGEWFANKSSATALFSMSYSRFGEEAKTELRNIYINLTQDEIPLVRKAAAQNLVEFLEVIEPEYIRQEFLPVLENIAQDTQDSVKPLAVDIGITIAKRVTDEEIKDSIFKIIEEFSRDESWKNRYKVASRIHDIQTILGVDKNRGQILNMFQSLCKDSESEVRVAAMGNLYNYCKALKESYEKSQGHNNFEPVFIQSIVPLIKFIIDDVIEDVQLAATSDILRLSTLMRTSCFEQHILPIVVEVLENHPYIRLKENILKQFDVLPADIDLSKYLDSIKKAMNSVVIDSRLHWRTRRSIMLAFVHLTKYIPKEYFDSNLRAFYFHLLDDQIFAVRRTASMILPLLAENFGMNWLMTSILPSSMIWSRHRKYLYRLVTLNGINELISPSIEKGTCYCAKTYLDYFKDQTSDNALKTLVRIVYLNDKLLNQLSTEKIVAILSNYNETDFVEENVKIYAEDTLNTLQSNRNRSVFALDDTKIRDDEYCYLEGVLISCIRFFIPVLTKLAKDTIQNVQIVNRYTLANVKQFAEKLKTEIEENWVQEKLALARTKDFQTVYDQLEVFMRQLSLGPSFKSLSYDDVLPDHIVTPSNESLPDLGPEVLDLEIDEDLIDSTKPITKEDVFGDLDENTEIMDTQVVEGEEKSSEVTSLAEDVINILDSKLASN